MQLVPLVHDTELSSSPPPGWRGDGLGTTCQVRPFHRSARVKFWKPEVPGICPRNQPTAMQLAALGQDTSLRLALITDCAVAADAGPAIRAARQPADSTASSRGVSLRRVSGCPFSATATSECLLQRTEPADGAFCHGNLRVLTPTHR